MLNMPPTALLYEFKYDRHPNDKGPQQYSVNLLIIATYLNEFKVL
jgi:hypothetical protein